MQVQYSHHARMRMIQRHIPEGEIIDVIANYHTRYADEAGNPIRIGHPSGRRIKVVRAHGRHLPLVITTAD